MPTGGRLSLDEVEECLQRLEEGKWIERDEENGNVSLGVRAELQRLYSRQGEPEQNAQPEGVKGES